MKTLTQGVVPPSILNSYTGSLKKVENYVIRWPITDPTETTEGSIYLATTPHEIVAIKVFYDHKELSFYREKEAYQLLKDNPYIAKTSSITNASLVYDTYKGDKIEKKPIIIMEYAHKSVLYWYIAIKAAKPISAPTCRKFMRMLIQGVRDMDAKGIGHRDLKPENIILTDEYTVKIIDFGHSSRSRDEKGEYIIYECPNKKSRFGTAQYRSPQLISGQKFTLIEYDLYSLGVLLFLLHTKMRPYDEINDKNHFLFVKDNEKYWENKKKELKKKELQITDDFIEMINCFLCIDRSRRPTLAKLKPYEEEYDWFKGPESSSEEVKEEMDQIFEKIKVLKKFKQFEEVVKEIHRISQTQRLSSSSHE